jgi:hypothetical protein
MKLYGGIDLHSNNSVVALLDEEDRVVYRKRLANEAATVLAELEPYRDRIEGLVVESTYNWYWLVDALMEAGYRLHLANTAAIVQYSGLKYSDDDADAAWLAKLLRLGLLPEGYIYPKAERAVRDLLRRRSRLVQQHTANLLAVQNLLARNRGKSPSANAIRQLKPEAVSRLPGAGGAEHAAGHARAGGGHRAAGAASLRPGQGSCRLPPTARRHRHRPGAGTDHPAGDRCRGALRAGRQLRLLQPLCG